MTKEQVFPLTLILLDLAASVVYGLEGNWRLCLYWLFAAGLTVVVTF